MELAYERRLKKDSKHLLVRVSAKSFCKGCKKDFVQLYTSTGGFKDAEFLKSHYNEEDLEKEELYVEPCTHYAGSAAKKAYFTKGKRGGTGTVRRYKPGRSVPDLIKKALQEFAYAVAQNRLTPTNKMHLIAAIDTLDIAERYIDELIYGAIYYVEKHVLPKNNIYRKKETISNIAEELKELIVLTRYSS